MRDLEGLRDLPGSIWRFSVKPTDAPALVNRLEALGAGPFLLDWGGGLVWAVCDRPQDLRGALVGQGHATVLRAHPDMDRVPRFHQRSVPIARIEAGLRTKFDPRGILNTGLMDS